MTDQKSKGVASLLASMPIIGWAGADKYYVGATQLGVFQTVLTLLIIGMVITIPWAWISSVVLVLAVFLGGIPYLYPTVNWAPVSTTDKVLAFVAIFILFSGSFVSSKKGKEGYKKTKESFKKGINN